MTTILNNFPFSYRQIFISNCTRIFPIREPLEEGKNLLVGLQCILGYSGLRRMEKEDIFVGHNWKILWVWTAFVASL